MPSVLAPSGGLNLTGGRGRPERVLVLGAGGGVGSMAAQMAAQAGAEVVAVGGPDSQGVKQNMKNIIGL